MPADGAQGGQESQGRERADFVEPVRAMDRHRRTRCRAVRARARVGLDASILEHHHAVGIGRHLRLMRYQDDGQPLFAVEAGDRGHDFGRGLRIDIAGRLVGQQDRRVMDQGASDGDALLLTARQLIGMVLLPGAEAKLFESPSRAVETALHLSGIEERECDILDRGGAGQQIEALEYEADALAANAGKVGFGQGGGVDAFQQITPAGRLIEAAQDIHQG